MTDFTNLSILKHQPVLRRVFRTSSATAMWRGLCPGSIRLQAAAPMFSRGEMKTVLQTTGSPNRSAFPRPKHRPVAQHPAALRWRSAPNSARLTTMTAGQGLSWRGGIAPGYGTCRVRPGLVDLNYFT